MSHPKYPHVFEPIQIGPMRLKNRIVGLPMMDGLPTADGRVTNEQIAFMVSRAKTGAGLVMVGDSAIDYDHAATHFTCQDLGEERNEAGFARMADAVHIYGAKIGVELVHGGAFAYERALKTGIRYSCSPSPKGTMKHNHVNQHDAVVLNRALMDEVIQSYCSAAERLMRCGFDMILLHCGHGWLLHQFLCPRLNLRADEYGGSLENRMRFPLEVLKALHDRVGRKMAIDIRVSTGGALSKYIDTDLPEMIEFVRAAGPYINCCNVSASDKTQPETSEYMCQSYYLPHMVNTEWAAKTKAAGVPVPVTATGSIVTVAEAEEILASGKADLVGMGRGTIVDDEHITKCLQGRDGEVRPCLRCARCTDGVFLFYPVHCAVNPRAGRETQYPALVPALKRRKILIAGGGPAGMEAAQIAARRGHDVVLYEKQNRLGGMLNTAAALPDKYDMRRYTEWQIKQTMACGARIVLGCEVTPEIIRSEAPDAVMLAIGAVPSIPPVPGIDGKNVVFAGDVDTGEAETGREVVIAGAGLTGCECAIPLARAGKKVTVLDMIPQKQFDDLGTGNQVWLSLKRLLRELDVNVILGAKISGIGDGSVTYTDVNGAERTIKADTVVNALGLRVDRDKIGELLGAVPETYTIGDCAGGAMTIDNAVFTGFHFAAEI